LSSRSALICDSRSPKYHSLRDSGAPEPYIDHCISPNRRRRTIRGTVATSTVGTIQPPYGTSPAAAATTATIAMKA
jgi:hypothetical protein